MGRSIGAEYRVILRFLFLFVWDPVNVSVRPTCGICVLSSFVGYANSCWVSRTVLERWTKHDYFVISFCYIRAVISKLEFTVVLIQSSFTTTTVDDSINFNSIDESIQLECLASSKLAGNNNVIYLILRWNETTTTLNVIVTFGHGLRVKQLTFRFHDPATRLFCDFTHSLTVLCAFIGHWCH